MQSSSEKDMFFQELDDGSKEEWRPPEDFYREPDNVCRGLSIPADALLLPTTDSFKGLHDADYYNDLTNIHKAGSSSSADQALVACLEQKSSSLEYLIAARFSEAARPPPVPADELYQFPTTTLRIRSSTPYEIGNRLLEFLTQAATANFKVNHKKFSFKGDVFDKNCAMCTVKVKVFQQEHVVFAVEFQRRKGDALAFTDTFSKATQYFQDSHLMQVLDAPTMNFCAPPPLPPPFSAQHASGMSEASFGPLLDMARLVNAPSLQAESAVALATMAEDNMMAMKLCTELVFQDVKTLLNTSTPEVDYPTAHLVHLLAQQQEAAQHFANQGLLSLMVEKVRSETTCTAAREELARGLGVAVAAQKRAMMTMPHSVELAHALGECINELASGVGNHMVVQNLREAQNALSF